MKVMRGARRRHTVGTVVVTATVLAMCAQGTASAATVSVSPSGFFFTANPGERNVVTLQTAPSSGWVGAGTPVPFFPAVGADSGDLMTLVADKGAPLRASRHCFSLTKHQAACALGGYHDPVLRLGDGHDRATTFVAGSRAYGDAGGDVIAGSPYFDHLEGGPGRDTIKAGEGNDLLIGGLGADNMNAGSGSDVVEARDGISDAVKCGPSSDYVYADAVDLVEKDCERRVA